MEQRFRPGPQVHSRRFDREIVVLDLGAGKYFSLDEVGAAIWEKLTDGVSVGEAADQIVADYEVDPDTAGRDVARLAQELVAAGLLKPKE
jgi:hypothetical protein